MTVNELLSRYGLVPRQEDSLFLRDLLCVELANAEREDSEPLKTICV
jgi:hypothetical protein